MWESVAEFVKSNPNAAIILLLASPVGIPPLVSLVQAVKGRFTNGAEKTTISGPVSIEELVTVDKLQLHLDTIEFQRGEHDRRLGSLEQGQTTHIGEFREFRGETRESLKQNTASLKAIEKSVSDLAKKS